MRCKDRSIPQAGDSMGQGDAWRNGLVAMAIGHHSQTFFYKQEKKTFNFDVVLPPSGPKGQFNAAGCSGYTIPVKAQHPDEAWAVHQVPDLAGPSHPDGQGQALGRPDQGERAVPAAGRQHPGPLQGGALRPDARPVQSQDAAIVYPPYLGRCARSGTPSTTTSIPAAAASHAEAAKRAQPQIQALLDKAWKA